MDIWKILGIEKTKSKEEIVEAYREQLAHNNPEENQEGFMALRKAYEEAMAYSESGDDEFDRLIGEMENIYGCFSKRIDPKRWKEIIEDPLLQGIDSRMNGEARIIHFLMDKYRLSREVFSLFATEFDWRDRLDELGQHFPPGFFNYVFDVIDNGEYYKMSYFDGDDYADYDLFIEKCMDLAGIVQQNSDNAKQMIEEVDALEIYHPYYSEIKAEYFIKQNDLTAADEVTQDFEELYPEEIRLLSLRLRILMKMKRLEEGRRIADRLKELQPENRMALLFDIVEKGETDIEGAKDDYYEFNRAYTYDEDAGEVAAILNDKLIPYLESRMDELTPLDKIALAWGYYERDEEERAYQFLESFEPFITEADKAKLKEDSDDDDVRLKYYKLKGYLAVQTERFSQAIEDIDRWEQLKEQKASEDKEEKTEAKLQNDINERTAIYRSKSYAYSMIGNNEKEEEYIHKIIEMDPRNLDAYITLNNIYLDAGKYDEVVEMNTEAMQRNGEVGPLLYLTGLAEFRRERYSDSIRLLDLALEYMPYLTRIFHYKLMMFDGWNLLLEFENQLEDLKKSSNEPLSPKLMELYEIKLQRMKMNIDEVYPRIDALIKVAEEEDEQLGKDDRALIYQEAANIYRERKSYDVALRYIEKALEHNPLNRSVELDKGYLLVLIGKYVEAEAFYTELVKKHPNDSVYYIRLAATKARSNDKTGAIQCYHQALELDPERYDIYNYIADVYVDMGDYDKATEYKNLLVEKDPGYESYYERANHLYHIGKVDEAYEDLQKAKEYQPYDSDVLTFLARCDMKRGDLEQAEQNYQKAFEYFDPERFALNTYMYATVKYIREKRYDKVVTLLEKAFEIFGEGGVWPLLRLAQAYHWTGNLNGAEKLYKRAIEIEPFSAEAHYQYAVYLYHTGRAQEGLKHFESLSKDQLNDIHIRRNFGLYCYMTLLDFVEAQKHYQKVLDLSKTEEDLYVINLFEAMWYELRSSHGRINDDLQIQKLFFVKKKKQRMEQFFQNMTRRAERYFEQNGVYEDANSAHWLSLMSECYFYQGNLNEAERFALMSLAIPPADFDLVDRSMDSLYILGMVQEQRGEYDKALEYYEEIYQRSAQTDYHFALFDEARERIKRKMKR
ncbi:MAG: tetratricopeptide repeat protein [Peptostreptococcaceae bacterium]|nr:tetratricopeptide repeat protein [Peptostreptococcaceae bacterium]